MTLDNTAAEIVRAMTLARGWMAMVMVEKVNRWLEIVNKPMMSKMYNKKLIMFLCNYFKRLALLFILSSLLCLLKNLLQCDGHLHYTFLQRPHTSVSLRSP